MKNIPHYAKVLDVGAGSGKYGLMLKDYFGKIHALEVYEPYIDKELEVKILNKYLEQYPNYEY